MLANAALGPAAHDLDVRVSGYVAAVPEAKTYVAVKYPCCRVSEVDTRHARITRR